MSAEQWCTNVLDQSYINLDSSGTSVPEKWHVYVKQVLVPLYNIASANGHYLKSPYISEIEDGLCSIAWFPGIIIAILPPNILECHPGLTLKPEPALSMSLSDIAKDINKIYEWLCTHEKRVFDIPSSSHF
jgi:hypothetical protein